ncbi:lipase 3-like [Sarcoptes scabiei]|nr:lipase 3-like [Sarcoptes scabiei]
MIFNLFVSLPLSFSLALALPVKDKQAQEEQKKKKKVQIYFSIDLIRNFSSISNSIFPTLTFASNLCSMFFFFSRSLMFVCVMIILMIIPVGKSNLFFSSQNLFPLFFFLVETKQKTLSNLFFLRLKLNHTQTPIDPRVNAEKEILQELFFSDSNLSKKKKLLFL